MAQRLGDKKKIFLEIFAGTLVLWAIFLLFNKYIVKNQNESNLVYNLKKKVRVYHSTQQRQKAIAQNITYGLKKETQAKQIRKKNLKLQTGEGRWVLTGDEEYYLFKKNGQLGIGCYDKNKKFKIIIPGIGESFSSQGEALLDLPAETEGKFKIYEQEDYLPIFGYHYVSPDYKQIEKRRHFLEMHLTDFRKQIAFATNEMGCHWLTFSEVMEKYVLPEKKTPRRTCVITFDDGHKDGYQYIFPVLKEFDISATFYIITDFIDGPAYMTWEQLDELYRNGNELGAHTLSAQGLVKTDWFEKKYHRQFTSADLRKQIIGSKERLKREGYNPKTFAYPLGEWNKEIVDVVKEAGFIAGRDTSRDYTSLDHRTPTVSLDPEFIWHMHYYKPELDDLPTLKKRLGYTGWWQFEDGYRVDDDVNNNVHRLSSLRDLTPQTFEVVSLPDREDKISNKFLVSQSGDFTLEIFASTGEKSTGKYANLSRITVTVDDQPLSLQPSKQSNCKLNNGKYYCLFNAQIHLEEGSHLISVTNKQTNFLRLDKFRIFRELSLKKNYELSIMEYDNR